MTTHDDRLAPDPTVEGAKTYAAWFACLSDQTRVLALSAVATAAGGSILLDDLARRLGISRSTCSRHVSRLADVGFVRVGKVGRTSESSVDLASCTGFPHAADVVLGAMQRRRGGDDSDGSPAGSG